MFAAKGHLPPKISVPFSQKTLAKRFRAADSVRPLCRAVAQLGSALEWGSRGREFESRRPDHFIVSSLVSIGFSWSMDVE